MRKLLAVLAILAGAASLTTAMPQLTADKELHQFGEVVDGAVVEHTYQITNSGSSDARINYVTYNCSCTSVSPSLRGAVLSPGESTQLTVTFRTANYSLRSQPVRITVTVKSNAPDLALALEGYVRATAADIRHTPPPTEENLGRSVAELSDALYLLIDVRDARDFRRNHLLGAVSIPGSALLSHIDDLPRGRMIYVYDDTGTWATHAVRTLRDHGYLTARTLAGGLIRWHSEVGDVLFDWTASSPGAVISGTPYAGDYSVPPTQLLRLYNVLVDVRPREAYTQSHLPGSLNLRPEEVNTWGPNLPRTEDLPSGATVTIWVVDQDGTQACTVAQELKSLGYENAFCLSGGLDEWRSRYGTSLLWSP